MTDRALEDFEFDRDALIAGVDLVGRSGAKNFEVGYLDDDVPVHLARWWAKAQYQGARLQEDEHRGPVEAVEALARRILDGGVCTHCGGRTHLGGAPRSMRRRGAVCAWKRRGDRWERGCRDRIPDGHRKINLPRGTVL